MSVSSAGQGLRPGVVTSTTRPSTPYTGQLIYETDTGYLRVWDGAAWDYLSKKQDDTVGLGPVGGLIYLGQATGSSVADVSINNVFSSTYESYRLVIRCVAADSNTTLRMRLLDSGGTPSTTTYYGRYMGFDPTTNGTTFSQSEARTDCFVLGGASGPEPSLHTIELGYPFESEFTEYHGQYNGVFRALVNSSGIYGGMHQTQSSYTGVRIYGSGGNITAKIRVYGYRIG